MCACIGGRLFSLYSQGQGCDPLCYIIAGGRSAVGLPTPVYSLGVIQTISKRYICLQFKFKFNFKTALRESDSHQNISGLHYIILKYIGQNH